MTTVHESIAAQQVIDPVCGMTIDPADAVGRVPRTAFIRVHHSALVQLPAS